MFFCYILKSRENKRYYVGSCRDVGARLKKHNQGSVKSTKAGRPWVLINSERFATRASAQRQEKKIKSWKKRSAIEQFIAKNTLRESSKTKVGP